MQLRIATGMWKNKKIEIPESARAVRERIRLAVFSILEAQNRIAGARILDLCAGSGSLGFEALSRGADHITFVDNDFATTESLKATVELLRNTPHEGIYPFTTDIVLRDANKFIEKEATYYDLIFFDPPYDLPVKHTLKIVSKLLNQNGILIYFHEKKSDKKTQLEADEGSLKTLDTRDYGITQVDFLAKSI